MLNQSSILLELQSSNRTANNFINTASSSEYHSPIVPFEPDLEELLEIERDFQNAYFPINLNNTNTVTSTSREEIYQTKQSSVGM